MTNYVLRICEAVQEAGGRALLVGGSVRDLLLGIESKDVDLEVYYLEPTRLREVLQSIARVNTVGEQFAVYKLAFYEPRGGAGTAEQRIEIDVSIPRRESKSGRGHRGFVITGDPFMSFEEAARRRDFTINAILQDPLTGETIDPFSGVADLQNEILRAVAADTFIEDSLRVLRAMQMAARFSMQIAPETIELCRTIDLSDLPHERIWGEFEKLLLRVERPSIGLNAALNLGILEKLLPDLQALAVEPQQFAEIGSRLDAAITLASDLSKAKRLTLMLAALCQDLPGEEAVTRVLDALGVFTIEGYNVREQVLALVQQHARPQQFFANREQTSDGDFRRLARLTDMNLLYRLAKADALSEPLAVAGGSPSHEAAEWFIARTRALDVEQGAPAPLLLGRHLLDLGLKPGPQMGEILRRVYELQLDGKVTTLEEAIAAALEK
jgi:tRNA nucleotidyltransferase (CCA-adding enzyme)